ncbi:hypothetical protein [Glycomyces albidus]|jgi:hypothetical protein|uniref:Uncharacterized protein n=1 Tax=Glycomyces albidus TaxID=2656774 RepID=A0A6L5GEZ3_9ACTN|nr:hypothetical protein [Glycomyces albidus]MQM28155.1 hypothetical protein [Glycomyces albidus]
MNDFDLHYLHYARSEELRKEAENERQARRILKAAKETRRGGSHVRHSGVADRVVRALGLRHGDETRGEDAGSGSSPRKERASVS